MSSEDTMTTTDATEPAGELVLTEENCVVLGPGGSWGPLSDFDYERWNECGTIWHVRIPGTPEDDSLAMEPNRCATLASAVEEVYHHVVGGLDAYGMTVASAAKLAIQLGLIVGTSIPVGEVVEFEGGSIHDE